MFKCKHGRVTCGACDIVAATDKQTAAIEKQAKAAAAREAARDAKAEKARAAAAVQDRHDRALAEAQAEKAQERAEREKEAERAEQKADRAAAARDAEERERLAELAAERDEAARRAVARARTEARKAGQDWDEMRELEVADRARADEQARQDEAELERIRAAQTSAQRLADDLEVVAFARAKTAPAPPTPTGYRVLGFEESWQATITHERGLVAAEHRKEAMEPVGAMLLAGLGLLLGLFSTYVLGWTAVLAAVAGAAVWWAVRGRALKEMGENVHVAAAAGLGMMAVSPLVWPQYAEDDDVLFWALINAAAVGCAGLALWSQQRRIAKFGRLKDAAQERVLERKENARAKAAGEGLPDAVRAAQEKAKADLAAGENARLALLEAETVVRRDAFAGAVEKMKSLRLRRAQTVLDRVLGELGGTAELVGWHLPGGQVDWHDAVPCGRYDFGDISFEQGLTCVAMDLPVLSAATGWPGVVPVFDTAGLAVQVDRDGRVVQGAWCAGCERFASLGGTVASALDLQPAQSVPCKGCQAALV